MRQKISDIECLNPFYKSEKIEFLQNLLNKFQMYVVYNNNYLPIFARNGFSIRTLINQYKHWCVD